MFLPELVSFRLPALPRFGKDQIAIFWLFIGVVLFHRDRLRSVRLGKWIKLAALLLLASHSITMFLNSDPVSYGAVYIPAHAPRDAVNVLIKNTLNYVLPLVLGAAMFNSSHDLRVLFRVLVGAALVYSIFQLIELRMSPQFHRWVYGFFQHSFAQTKRGDGFRPTVFMQNGLAVAMFTAAGVLAAAGLYKIKIKVFRIPPAFTLGYLWLILLLSKSLAALFYSLMAVPLIVFTRPKTQFRIAVLLAVVVLVYPDARAAGLVPVEDIRQWVEAEYGEQKVSSLMTRFINEDTLLERSSERPFFGWGTYGRASVYSPRSGKEIAIRDGDWIITWGEFGRFGFFGKYLFLLLPIFLSARQLRRIRRPSDRRLLAALSLIIGFSVFDFLPNGNFHYLVFALSGALMGCSNGIVRHRALRARRKRWESRKVPQSIEEATPVGVAATT